jgi:hypothetical protein
MVLALGIIVLLLVAAVAAFFALRRRSHDDAHSVEGYHRQLHTLEVLRTHPPGQEGAADGDDDTYPERASRVAAPTTVRLTEPGKAVVPPVPPLPVADPDKPVTFDDAGPVITTPQRDSSPGTHSRKDDKALHGINHRPRRLAAPAAAIGAVLLVIVVLVVAGLHSVPKVHHHNPAAGSHGTTPKGHTKSPHHHTVTTTTVGPVVSLPRATSRTSAVYAVQPNTYSLTMSATTSECWVQATEAGSGTVLFSGVLNAGQTQTVSGVGAVSLIVGAPNSFAANINGTSVSFPFGYQAPFTMQFLVASSPQA